MIRWVLLLSFSTVVSALVVVSLLHGTDRGDDFEIIVISVVWSTVIVAGPLVAAVLRRSAAPANASGAAASA